MDDWMSSIKIDDVPEQYHDVIKIVSLPRFLELMQTNGGTYYYIPKADVVLRRIRNEKIKEEFNGSNHKALAIKFNLTEITIRRIVEGGHEYQLPGQISLLDAMGQ